MFTFDEERTSDSPLVERIWRCHNEGAASFLSIAESRSELVVTRLHGKLTMTVRGPETRATYFEGHDEAEWLGIRLKPGMSLSALPVRTLVDSEVDLPEATNHTFWLGGWPWQFPTYENAEIFVRRLVRAGLLVRDSVIKAALAGQVKDLTPRSVQYHFLQATGITQNMARQIERARYATLLLTSGVSISETILLAGYYDQPHLTRSLVHFIGQTPAELLHHSRPEQLSFLYKTTPFG